MDSTSTDGPPRVAIANLSKYYFCPSSMCDSGTTVPYRRRRRRRRRRYHPPYKGEGTLSVRTLGTQIGH